ncbi:response regulator transcription factor [Kibdelosporangium phytohabitans]|uniref:Transcriptional regulator n=1 Tax=Kibdelosporangium phytohabitans TaxID=860235 RepID=A0A0N9HT33_9PSEU|nr:response regulator transcription factor [Kibdelosporangium phytohabitans]ALG08218.1 transcriptional regulator [Kibdelosporangium phytohabitans]MBE1470778.1 DNA-binding response OmpR family regulator [Kibdelosporangium phytohabitans]
MRILLVEDDVRLAGVLFSGLAAEGIDVDVAHDGAEGYWQALDGAHDVIVLDVLLPSMNGYSITERLRGQRKWTPILLLTAKDGEYDEADGLDVGADDYLRKPFSFVVLVARLRALARRGATPRPRLLSHGSLTLDPASGDCTVEGSPIVLRPRERALLEVLLRNRDRVVSKGGLSDAVWGLAAEHDPNLVEVHISYLRRKIGSARLRTVRGLGYRLVDPDA